ncbi:hypothetical protein [Oleiharenicola lentus]|uniref:hypothetical protein n=1 Tax=Oleiharenicola lentus TaxID=2508720 RepID=UPI003F67E756
MNQTFKENLPAIQNWLGLNPENQTASQLESASRLFQNTLGKLEQHPLLKHLNRINSDILGSYEPENVKIEIYWMPIALFATNMNVPVETLTALVTSHEFAHAYKTRRKGRARPGFEAHKVTYDGRQLVWPWTEDSFGLQQAESRAGWLSEWVTKMTGITVPAKPLLVLPGWYVVPKGVGMVSVLNHKQLHGAITRTPGNVLNPSQIDLIARQLDNLCRDVED